ncbi:DUF1990 domain-containing protein [Actinomycetospora endophytica]|uniref:DUF1990 domain-containing protein n=1 Tax=Actinomycetospora endophytica TaxID=2291215 RepID=A0ABS8P537_9PSEU|nr:DUF1990 family protein [Actinomycetospora endophytica]MCD2193366.1 DUF1990 domain-containing protein [Actinomycetospora endophytica]
MRTWRFSPVSDPAAGLAEIAGYALNYDPGAAGGHGWHHDRLRHTLAVEDPGDPEPGGPWEIACALVRDYEFSDRHIMSAMFHSGAPLVGRDMLLEGRFLVLRLPMGVRVDAEIDETRERADGATERAWGWSYRTLEHHLERGRLVYEVVKNTTTGRVEFVITGVSSRATIRNPVLAVGFTVFGRVTQRRFYRTVAHKLADRVRAVLEGGDRPVPDPIGPDDVVRAPARDFVSSR